MIFTGYCDKCVAYFEVCFKERTGDPVPLFCLTPQLELSPNVHILGPHHWWTVAIVFFCIIRSIIVRMQAERLSHILSFHCWSFNDLDLPPLPPRHEASHETAKTALEDS